MSKHHDDFYWLNCIHSFAARNKLESHKRSWENKDFCNTVMASQDTKMLESLINKPFINYADLEYLIEKINGCKNNPENSSTIKVCDENTSHQVFQCLQYHHLKA